MLEKMALNATTFVDLTSLFKSCVKTIRTRNKAMGLTLPQSNILPSNSSPTSQLYSRAKDTLSHISNHNNLLKEHRKKYLCDTAISDVEKNNMEKVVATNLKIFEEKVKSLDLDSRNISKENKLSNNASECLQNLILILRANLQRLNYVFRELKELRQIRQREKERLFRLQPPIIRGSKRSAILNDGHNTDIQKSGKHISNNSGNTKQTNITPNKSEDTSKTLSNCDSGSEDGLQLPNEQIEKGDSSSHNHNYLDDDVSGVLEELTSEERQLLEQENAHLYQELQSNQEEVRQITKQVVELGKMQDMLTENVEIQAHQIEEIQDTIMASTENVQEGNEQVREAMRKDAGFRVWIMFFLITMSFTILFLDWYNS